MCVFVCGVCAIEDAGGYFTPYLPASQLPNLAGGQKKRAGDKRKRQIEEQIQMKQNEVL